LRPWSAAWQSSLIANLSNITLGRAPAVEVEAHVVTGRCCVAAMTLVRSHRPLLCGGNDLGA
jgi:hypothetical protein